jgi:adenylosuccinate synthase
VPYLPDPRSEPFDEYLGTDVARDRLERCFATQRISLAKLLKTEKTSTTNRDRRVSEFDWALLRKAAALNGPTDVALTFADYLHKSNEDARRFEQLHLEDIQFIEQIERVAAAPVSLISTRFDFRSIIDRRAW